MNFIKIFCNRFVKNFSNKKSSIESKLFLLTLIWGVGTFWIPSKLPLIDLPQHAAQATMFKDILLNQFSWTDTVTINWATPYLSSYLVVTLLSYVVSVSTAFKLMLSVAYITFVYICVLLRRHYKIDVRLDWLFLLPFFGYAYQWGFVPFILSAPISLWFVYLALRYSETSDNQYGLLLLLAGFILLETHGLMFLFSVGVGGSILILSSSSFKKFLICLWPYLLLMIVFIITYSFNSKFNSSIGMTIYSSANASNINWDLGARRLLQGLVYSIARNNQSIPYFILLPSLLMVLISPWLVGMKIDLGGKKKVRGALFVQMWLVILFVPNTIYETSQLYQRFAIFLIPSYLLLFTSVGNRSQPSFFISDKIKTATLFFIIISCWLMLSFHSYNNWQFNQAIKSFERITQGLEENQRAYVVSNNLENDKIGDIEYNWFGFWFQAEKHGFAEPSFGSMASFPVRYNKQVSIHTLSNLGNLNIDTNIQYRYFIVRTTGSLPSAQLFAKFNCKPIELIAEEKWKIYDNKHCIKN